MKALHAGNGDSVIAICHPVMENIGDDTLSLSLVHYNDDLLI
jgi:hypothetical protein